MYFFSKIFLEMIKTNSTQDLNAKIRKNRDISDVLSNPPSENNLKTARISEHKLSQDAGNTITGSKYKIKMITSRNHNATQSYQTLPNFISRIL